MRVGLDIGSTTIKCVVVDDYNTIIESSYDRHYSKILEKTIELVNDLRNRFPAEQALKISISGSAGMGIADACDIPFVQEVYATRLAAQKLSPSADVIIELGGEDAKILFLQGSLEVRMNGSCAGGTGAFIDQMATLLNISVDEMNEAAKEHEKIYTIASRCGVFAKSDIQPLLNQGARKSDISASIFYAVVNQTIGGLAQGHPIRGNVVYLGGPLTFLSELRAAFDNTLNLNGTCPENSLYFVALGAAYHATEDVNLQDALNALQNYHSITSYNFSPSLFENEEQYVNFKKRHAKATVKTDNLENYSGDVYLGIDAGSTTLKTTIVSKEGTLLASSYQTNNGNPVPLVKQFLDNIYKENPALIFKAAAVTGYGEEMIKNAFKVDYGVVETVAHLTAAKHFMPNVDFIIDIGGQDMKCFKIKNGTIDNIFLNEACSSGCGSFLQTFASAMHKPIEEFATLGLFADKPVDLGSRCTVFMNSSVKQAQKDGASIENISAGLSISVVKNALYKVIRPSSKAELGEHIVVQGGTFLNDAVLRAFEQELEIEVTRPDIAGLMGAYGAALYAKEISEDACEKPASSILNTEQLEHFEHTVSVVNCGLCPNNCRLTVNTFDNGRKFIGGNRCERPVTQKKNIDDLNLFAYKYNLLQTYKGTPGKRGKIGIPMGLNMYELLPFWHAFFTSLGFEVVTSPSSNRDLYLTGQATIPSDTVCFPAKLMHGHVQMLLNEGIETIFYPCMSYNLDEQLGDNHYNCPVVAYYPEVLAANMEELQSIKFIYDYVGIHRPKDFPKKIHEHLERYFNIPLKEVEEAAKKAYEANSVYLNLVREKAQEMITSARSENKQIIILAGRPYHIDPEVHHGIDALVSSFGVCVLTEEAVSHLIEKFSTRVLNQWTYHSRLYAAAKYSCSQPDMSLVQLVSFGCGVDAITTDETREILEKAGNIYTQIKIDEITNLGAVKIRLRSLFAALERQA